MFSCGALSRFCAAANCCGVGESLNCIATAVTLFMGWLVVEHKPVDACGAGALRGSRIRGCGC